MRWLINGREAAAISIEDRSVAYGDGLFETIAWRAGAARFFDAHLARLTAGCRRLDLPVPDINGIAAQMAELAGGAAAGLIKLILTRGAGPRGYAPPSSPQVTLAIGFDAAVAPRLDAAGWSAMSCGVPVSINRHLAGLKTLNRLDQVLASAEYRARGADEGLMFGPAGQLVGGTRSNVFLVIAGGLLTPALDEAGICGIMRAEIMETARDAGVSVSEGRIGPMQLSQAQEMFVSNALIGLQPLREFDGRTLHIGAITRALGVALAHRGVESRA